MQLFSHQPHGLVPALDKERLFTLSLRCRDTASLLQCPGEMTLRTRSSKRFDVLRWEHTPCSADCVWRSGSLGHRLWCSMLCRVQGLRAQGLSVSSTSLIIGNSLHLASLTFPEFQWVDRKGGDGRPGEKQSRAALGQGPVSPSMDTHNNIFELFCRD